MILKATQLGSGVGIWTQVCLTPEPLPTSHQIPQDSLSNFPPLNWPFALKTQEQRLYIHSVAPFSRCDLCPSSCLVPESLLLKVQAKPTLLLTSLCTPSTYSQWVSQYSLSQLLRKREEPRSWISARYLLGTNSVASCFSKISPYLQSIHDYLGVFRIGIPFCLVRSLCLWQNESITKKCLEGFNGQRESLSTF